MLKFSGSSYPSSALDKARCFEATTWKPNGRFITKLITQDDIRTVPACAVRSVLAKT